MRLYVFLTFACLRRDFSLSHRFRNSPGFSLLSTAAHSPDFGWIWRSCGHYSTAAKPARRHPGYRKNSPPQRKKKSKKQIFPSRRIRQMWSDLPCFSNLPRECGRLMLPLIGGETKWFVFVPSEFILNVRGVLWFKAYDNNLFVHHLHIPLSQIEAALNFINVARYLTIMLLHSFILCFARNIFD